MKTPVPESLFNKVAGFRPSKFCKFQRKTPVPESFLNKVADLRPSKFCKLQRKKPVPESLFLIKLQALGLQLY